MADIFCDNAGSNTSPYDTWAKAATTLTAALAIATASDTIYVANTHSESTASAVTLTCPTSGGLRILTVTPNGASGNSGLNTGAVVAVGAASVLLVTVGFAYIYGIKFQGGTNNSSAASIDLVTSNAPGYQTLESCVLELRTASGSAGIRSGSAGNTANDDAGLVLINTTLKFSATGQQFHLRHARTWMVNVSLDAAGSAPTTLFICSAAAHVSALIEASDLSGVSWTNFITQAVVTPADVTIRDCKVPASINWTTGTHSGPGGLRLNVHNVDSGDTQYNLAQHWYEGSVVDETTIVRTGGGAQSRRFDTTANVGFPFRPLMYEGHIYNSAVGSSKTLTVEVIHSGIGSGTGGALTNKDMWVQLLQLGTSGFPQSVFNITDRAADVLASAADQDTSSVSWASSPATPQKQKLVATFTPQEVGYIHYQVCFAKASAIAYADILGATLT